MQGPAPVSLDSAGDGGVWKVLVIALHGLAVAALLAWRPGPWTAVAAFVVAGAGLVAWRRTSAASPALRFDGRAWTLDGGSVDAGIALDLGTWILLRLAGAGGVQWLPVSAARAGASWPSLRAALYATAVRPVDA